MLTNDDTVDCGINLDSVGELFGRWETYQNECTMSCMSLETLDIHRLELLFNVVTQGFPVENGQYLLDNNG